MATLAQPMTAQPGFKSVALVSELDYKHPWTHEYFNLWGKLSLLYQGGDAMCRAAADFLTRRPKELSEIFAARCAEFSYQNILGAGVDWYLASMFLAEPEIDYMQDTAAGPQEINLPAEQKSFYDSFQKNCDRRRTNFVTFFRDALKSMLLYESAWVLVDLPKPSEPPATLADQKRLGLIDPYVVRYEPSQVLNWGEDQFGVLQWVVIKVQSDVQEFLSVKPKVSMRWYYFDRQQYAIYEAISEKNKGPKEAQLIDSGPHALAMYERVPVHRLQVPPGLWLANRVYPQVREHLNTDNRLGWALKMAALAMPVVIGNVTETPVLSEAGYLKFPENTLFDWTEPQGTSWMHLAERINVLREEIYRQMYLMAQGRSAADSPTVQSGYAKQLEMTPSGEIENLFGAVLREGMINVLRDVAAIRGDQIDFYVRGFQFLDKPIAEEINDGMAYKSAMVPSPTGEKENYKRIARARFPNSNPTMMTVIEEEIDAAPTDEEKMLMQQEQDQANYADQFANMAELAAKGDEVAAEEDAKAEKKAPAKKGAKKNAAKS